MKSTYLFDLDGVLLRTWLHTQLALGLLLEGLGHDAEQLYRIADQMGVKYSFRGLLETIGLDPSTQRAQIARYNETIRREGNSCLFPGMVQLVNDLAADGHPVGLITRGVVEHQQAKFASLTLLHDAIPRKLRLYVPPDGAKGDAIAARYGGEALGVTVVENSVDELLALNSRVPGAQLYRMIQSNGDPAWSNGDNRLWLAMRSPEELNRRRPRSAPTE